MADMMSIIAANYKTVGMTVPSKTPYVAVDPALYEGSWTGKYADQKTFKITVSNVTGFRAKVQYQSGGTSKFQEVLIKDNAFRVGDTKFELTSGDFAFGPKGVPHTFYGSAPATRALVGFSPMQFEGFMRTVGQPAPERVLPPHHDGPPPDVAKLAPIAERNGFIILGPPGPPPGQPRGEA